MNLNSYFHIVLIVTEKMSILFQLPFLYFSFTNVKGNHWHAIVKINWKSEQYKIVSKQHHGIID